MAYAQRINQLAQIAGMYEGSILKQSHPGWLQWLTTALLLVMVTWIGAQWLHVLNTTGVVMLYLLVVVVAAYCFEITTTLVTVAVAFFSINYFFIAPTHTFQVGSITSWASLISFLVVAIVIASLVKQLKAQTALSMTASEQAAFARTLSEQLAAVDDLAQLTAVACALLSEQYHMPFKVIETENTQDVLIDSHALTWAASTGQTMGPFTSNWPESDFWLIPFSRLPSTLPCMWVGHLAFGETSLILRAPVNKNILAMLQSHVEQVSQAYQRIQNHARAKQAELLARQESMQNALLTSISHDMRTPLTAILGASTALKQFSSIQLDSQLIHLASMIASQATYLTTTTENILSLIRLETSSPLSIPMDWQSPEELIGMVMSHYQYRDDRLNIQTRMHASDVLIKANAHLLTQALVNLIENAKQASEQAAPILLEVRAEEEWLDFSVIDSGAGFDVDFDVTQIQKFSTQRRHGLGLGLPIVQLIAKLHDAQLLIENRQSASGVTGARVTLRFKLALPEAL